MFDFNILVENFLKRELKPRKDGVYYPSEVGGCLRKSWYSYKNPKQLDSDLIKIFQAGELIHEFVATVLKSEKNPHIELIGCEEPFQIHHELFTISGRIDDLILLKEDNIKVLVEVKSTSNVDVVQEAKDAHVLQLMVYMRALDIHKGVILYMEKNSLNTKTFTVDYDEKKWRFVLNRFKTLHESIITNTIPDPEGRIDPSMRWLCGRCPYRQDCYEQTPQDVLP